MEKKQTYTEERPWGKFEQFTHNEMSTVKIITVKAGEELSHQYHNNRDEFWRVLSGEPEVLLGEKWIKAKPGDEFFIPKTTIHSIRGTDTDASWLEISYGEFDENDNIRLKDKYGRSSPTKED